MTVFLKVVTIAYYLLIASTTRPAAASFFDTFNKGYESLRDLLFPEDTTAPTPPMYEPTIPEEPIDIIINSNCGSVNGESVDDADCGKMGAAYWFIVLDVSGGSKSGPEAAYLEDTLLVKDMIYKLGKLVQEKVIQTENIQIAIFMATRVVQVMKRLCKEEYEEFPATMSTSPSPFMDKVLSQIDKEVRDCHGDPNRQRIVLYVVHRDLVEATYSSLVEKSLLSWNQDYTLHGKRSTLIFSVILSSPALAYPYIGFQTFNKTDLLRGLVYIEPGSKAYMAVRASLGVHLVQCACLLSEDCKINTTTIKPCHFNLVGKEEQCTRTVNERIESRPKFARHSERSQQQHSCKETRLPKAVACEQADCLADCDKKDWSEWSECDKRGDKHRSRSNNKNSHSEFTKSCPANESQSCDPTTIMTTPAAVRTTTEMNFMTSTWALIFLIFVLSGSVVGGAVVFVCVRRRRRHRMPHFVAARLKGRGYGRAEPDSVASTATESRATLRAPDGRGSVSFARNDSQVSKTGKDGQGRNSTFKKQKASIFRPRTTSMKVSLIDHKRSLFDSKGKNSKFGSSKSSQSVKKTF